VWQPRRYELQANKWTRIYVRVDDSVDEIRIENLSATNTIRLAPVENAGELEYTEIKPYAVRYENFNPNEIWAMSTGTATIEIDVRKFGVM
jgi:hypothetical protein